MSIWPPETYSTEISIEIHYAFQNAIYKIAAILSRPQKSLYVCIYFLLCQYISASRCRDILTEKKIDTNIFFMSNLKHMFTN